MERAQSRLPAVFGALLVSLVSMLAASTAIAADVIVGNHSFETTASGSGDWRKLPVGGDWVDGNSGDYEILKLDAEGLHFPSYGPPSGALTPPAGDNVLNLSNASPMSQNLSYAVNAGDVITLDFLVGNSSNQSDPPTDVNAKITLDGADVHTAVVTNNAPDGDFAHKSVQWTATSGGNLGIELSSGEGAWIDDVGVDVSTAATIRGDVNITNWNSVYFSDGTYDPTAGGLGGVNNSLPESDANSYGSQFPPPGPTDGSQTYGVTYADGSAASDIGAPFFVGFGNIYPNVTAGASLDIDMTGAPLGTSAEGLTTGGTGGTTFDGSDPGGDGDDSFAFEVDFTIDALAAGSSVDGAFGIQVDIFQWGVGDLGWGAEGFQPYVTGTGITGSVDMTEEDRTDGLGDAWTFALTAAEIAALGGSVDGTYTAHFDFDEDFNGNAFTGNPNAYVTINAFALGEAEAAPAIMVWRTDSPGAGDWTGENWSGDGASPWIAPLADLDMIVNSGTATVSTDLSGAAAGSLSIIALAPATEATVEIASGGTLAVTGDVNVGDGGNLNIRNGTLTAGGVSVTAGGSLALGDNSAGTAGLLVIDGDATDIQLANLTLGGGSMVRSTHAVAVDHVNVTVSDKLTIVGDGESYLGNNGALGGDADGNATNLTLGDSAVIDWIFGGVGADNDSYLTINGLTTLGASLRVNIYAGGGSADGDDVYLIRSLGGVVNPAAAILGNTPAGWTGTLEWIRRGPSLWDLQLTGLTTGGQDPGDTDGNGIVHETDMLNLQKVLGLEGTALTDKLTLEGWTFDADFDDDGDADLDDFVTLRESFGNNYNEAPASPDLSQAPEPATMSLMLLGLGAVIRRRRKS